MKVICYLVINKVGLIKLQLINFMYQHYQKSFDKI